MSPIWWKTKVDIFNINKTKEEKHKQNTSMNIHSQTA